MIFLSGEMALWLWMILGTSRTGRRPSRGMEPAFYAPRARKMRSSWRHYETRKPLVSRARTEECLGGRAHQKTGVQPGTR